VAGGLESVPDVVERFKADTVAVLACPEMSGVRLRELAWALEKTGTDLCVAPAGPADPVEDMLGSRAWLRGLLASPSAGHMK
jgi:hypothetical protein